MNSKLLLIVVLIILLVGVMLTVTDSKTSPPVTQDAPTQTTQTDEDPMDDDAHGGDDTMVDDKVLGNTELASAGIYETYTSDLLSNAQEGDVILFFKATWCPSCRGLDSDIKKNLSDIPEGVTILEVDYDTATDLRKKYGVTTQHTLVQVAADGSLIQKWTGSPTLKSLVSKL